MPRLYEEVGIERQKDLLKLDLRFFDQREVDLLGGINLVIKDCFKNGRVFVGTTDKGETACVFGVVPSDGPLDPAVLWLMTSPLVVCNKLSFVKGTVSWLGEMLREYGYLQAFVLEENVTSQKWLQRLGFIQKGQGPMPLVGNVLVFERTL